MTTKLNLNGKTVEIEGQVAALPDQAPAAAMAVPVGRVRPNPQQPRQEFEPAGLEELAASIKEHGVIQPIVVEPVDPTDDDTEMDYMLHDGERRLRAAKIAGLETIPAYIVSPGADGQQLLIRAVVANLQRTDLNPIELAQSYQQLADQGLSDTQIAKKVGKSRSTVANARRLLGLPEERRRQVVSGDLSERQAMALVSFYQLPEKAQKAMQDTWEGRRLAEPEKLTSDEIRKTVTRAIDRISTPINNWKIDDDIANDGYLGSDAILQSKCAGCPHLLGQSGKHNCTHKKCHEAKENVLKSRALIAASESTGVKWLEPNHNYSYSKVHGFYNDEGNAPIVEHALENKCPNLHLEYYFHYSHYCRPEGHDPNLRYVCLCLSPGNGERTCLCRRAVHADAHKKQAAAKAEIDRLKAATVTALAAALQQIEPATLRVIGSYAFTNAREEKFLTGDIDKLANKLAAAIVDRKAWYDSPERCRTGLAAWLAPLGFTVGNIVEEQVLALVDKLDRIWEWAQRLKYQYEYTTKIKQVAGNITNLANLAEQATALQESDPDPVRELFSKNRFWSRFDTLKTVLAGVNEDGSDPAIETTHILQLLDDEMDILPERLRQINEPATLKYALDLLPLFDKNDQDERRQLLMRRMTTLSGLSSLTLQLSQLEAWLTSAEYATASKKKLVNRGIKVADLSHKLRELDLSEEHAAAIQARIDDLEQQYLERSRTVAGPVGAQTPDGELLSMEG